MRLFDAQYIQWLDLVAELLRRPGSEMPRGELLEMLGETFEGRPSWSEVRADGALVFDSPAFPEQWPGDDEYQWWHQHGSEVHPLIRWFLITGDFAAFTLGRVPAELTEYAGRSEALERLAALGLEQQLSIPCAVDGDGTWAFVMARPGEDFTRDDLELARLIQPLLALVARQVKVAGVGAETTVATAGPGLTGRELAVLRLLCDGLTAAAIGRRLGMSARTVDKHLEHLYRKLGVRDRLMAYQVAVQHGLVPNGVSAWSRSIGAAVET